MLQTLASWITETWPVIPGNYGKSFEKIWQIALRKFTHVKIENIFFFTQKLFNRKIVIDLSSNFSTFGIYLKKFASEIVEYFDLAF